MRATASQPKLGLVPIASEPNFTEKAYAALKDVILPSLDWHLKHICGTGDPFEQGSSRPLDFGHWAAHKLEQLSEYKIRHGEAVAIGIAQGIAIVPAISRSGFTVAASLLFGLRRDVAGRFSFVISVPAIAGARALDRLPAPGPQLRFGGARPEG